MIDKEAANFGAVLAKRAISQVAKPTPAAGVLQGDSAPGPKAKNMPALPGYVPPVSTDIASQDLYREQQIGRPLATGRHPRGQSGRAPHMLTTSIGDPARQPNVIGEGSALVPMTSGGRQGAPAQAGVTGWLNSLTGGLLD